MRADLFRASLRRSGVLLVLLLLCATCATGPAGAREGNNLTGSAAEDAALQPADPATWEIDRLAAQLVNACVPMTDMDRAVALARGGIGGITLLGGTAPSDLPEGIAAVRRQVVDGIRPTVVADEEGGAVQRLDELIGALPSAAIMGGWDRSRIRATAREHGEAMRDLGVGMAFAPVADLTVPGAYMAELGRTFSEDPQEVASAVLAFSAGLEDAGVVGVVKHWPGHGHAVDSHVEGATIPPFSELAEADLVPFAAAFDAGAPAVMVGHLQSAGLTEPGTPASISPAAMAELRDEVGPETVIVTDSLTMGAVTSAVGLSGEEAAVRALQAGADWALTCALDTAPTLAAVAGAIADGSLPRDDAVAKARRILALKARTGDAPRAAACREPLVALPDGPAAPTDPPPLPAVERLAGPDRAATAAAVSRDVWPDGSAVAYVATGADFADALAATPAAAADAAPVLLTGPTTLPDATRAELARLDPTRIVIVGGQAAVGPTVEEELAGTAPVTRVAGADRFATAVRLAERLPAGADTAWLVAADRFADGMAAGARAATDGAPLLLTGHGELPEATAAALAGLQPERVVVVGGQAAVCDGVLAAAGAAAGATTERLAGSDRYATAALLARPGAPAWLASGETFADALPAGAAAAHTGGQLLLVPAEGALPGVVRAALAEAGGDRLAVVGGPAAVADEVLDGSG